jgi:hypothetical protein
MLKMKAVDYRVDGLPVALLHKNFFLLLRFPVLPTAQPDELNFIEIFRVVFEV